VADELAIASAEARDADVIVALLDAQLREHDIATSTDDLRDVTNAVIADPRHGFILMARTGATPIGLAYAAAHLSAEHGGGIGWLEELYVVPSWRGRGAGSALLERVLARAAELGWRALELEVVRGHERAVPLYSRHGFRTVDRARFSRIF
jgi:putative acetyltransferase